MIPSHEAWSQQVVNAQGLSVAVQAFTTTRAHGLSLGPYAAFNLGDHVGDDPQAVRQNREQLQLVLPQTPCWLNQVHGIDVFDADTVIDPFAQGGASIPTADAAVTSTPERVLAILTADCLPVVISADQSSVLGVAHAGWRGLADGVLLETLAAMRCKASAPLTLRAWIGPGIGPQAFQVGGEVRQRFMAIDASLDMYFQKDPVMPDKWRADLAAIAAWQLVQQGVTSVHRSGLCTMTDPLDRFFSYRRDGQTGRMATLAWLKSVRA